MKKNLLTLGLLGVCGILSAQTSGILMHVDQSASVYVSKGALVYNGGGLQTKDDGVINNHGDIMIVGGGDDYVKTITSSGSDKDYDSGGTNIVNYINEPDNFATWNTNDSNVTPTYTYGQLYISGIPQDNITAIVDEQFKYPKHGDYQQIGFPFYGKTFSSLNSEFGKTFSTVRRSKNEILVYNNAKVVLDNLGPSGLEGKMGEDYAPYSYYSIGANNLDVSAEVRSLKGRPVSDQNIFPVPLKDAGAGINFGINGSSLNEYNGRYNTYLQDFFAISRGHNWDGTDYGKNLYQFGNPFMTNLDLLKVKNTLSNVIGIRVEPENVTFNANTGGGSHGIKFVTFGVDSNIPSGDDNYLIVRPFGTFVIKLDDNSKQEDLNIAKLRRLSYYSNQNDGQISGRQARTSVGTVKQLAVIGLDSNNEEVARTYYVVSPQSITGHSAYAYRQVANSGGKLGTYEESPDGGYDNNYTGSYWLYINEANESNFTGKNVKLVKYTGDIVKYKFEIKEDAQSLGDGKSQLSTGNSFYIRTASGNLQEISNNDIIAADGSSTQDYDLYYGRPQGTLSITENSVSKGTVVVYNPSITDYIVRFAPGWNKANVTIYDMSGKLILSKDKVSTSADYVLGTTNFTKGLYIVRVVSDKGEIAQTKIIK